MTVDKARTVVWEYLCSSEELPHRVDLAIVLGSRDERVAIYAAEVLRDVPADNVIITGGAAHHGDRLEMPTWAEGSEAARFAAVMKARRYSGELKLEEKATHTGENIAYSAAMVQAGHMPNKTVLVFTKPYMTLRALRTFEKQWPFKDSHIYVRSWLCSFEEYVDETQTKDLVTHIMVGDLQRIMEYPKQGFMTVSSIPDEVLQAFKVLVRAGFTKHLL